MKNEYFKYKLNNGNTLITTRHKAWAVLTNEELSSLEDDTLISNISLYRFLENLGIIINERNKRDILKAFGIRYGFLFRPPRLFIMAISNRCNLACRYCHAIARKTNNRLKYDMTTENVHKTVDFFLSIPRIGDTFHIELQGGETLIRYDLIKETMDYAEKMASKYGYKKCTFALVSNLTLMNDDIAKEIVDRGNVSICTSLEGPRDIHDKQRYYSPGIGSYDKVTYWIDRLAEKYHIKVGIIPVCTKNHIGRGKDLVDEYVKYSKKSIYMKYVNRTGKAHMLGYENIGLTVEEYLELWKDVIDYCIELNNKGTFIMERKATSIYKSMVMPNFDYMCHRRPCGAGISQLAVNYNGDIYACDGGRSVQELKIGDINNNTYDELITCNNLRSLRSLVVEVLPQCASCPFGPFCGYCVSRGINEHGNPIPKSPIDFECKVYRDMIPHLIEKLLDPSNANVINKWIYTSFH